MGKNFYNYETVLLAKKVYGNNSQIVQLMLSGEKISHLVKADIKKKGVPQDFKSKKKLFQLAKEDESYKELEETYIANGMIEEN